MAYIVRNNGAIGYTRADFIAALATKQDKLYDRNTAPSGKTLNIKTINGVSVLGSGNLPVNAKQYTYNLSDLEVALKQQAISDVNYIKQLIVNSEGNSDNISANDLFVVGVISDLHHCRPEDTYGNYGNNEAGVHTDAEPSLRLLGAVINEIQADAVICCGDLSAGQYSSVNQPIGRCAYPRAVYDVVVGEVLEMFEQYIPCPYFFCDGNHDRGYGYSVSGNVISNREWLTRVKQMNNPMSANVEITDIQDIIEDNDLRYVGGDVNGQTLTEDEDGNGISCSYVIDFKDKKIRCAMLSSNEWKKPSTGQLIMNWGSHITMATYASTVFSDPSVVKDWTLLAFSHSWQNQSCDATGGCAYTNTNPSLLKLFVTGGTASGSTSGAGHTWAAPNKINGVAQKGKILAGMIHGHEHYHLTGTTDGVTRTSVSASFANRSNYVDGYPTTANSYSFDIFIIDPINYYLYQIQVGKTAANNASDAEYEYTSRRVAREGGTTDVITGIYRHSILHS